MKKILIHKKEQGFSLIEVLITTIILAVGLLSIASLQFKGLQYSNDAFMRSHANILASDIIDRVRLNSANVNDYVDKNFVVPTDCTGNAACDPASCNPALTTAANDLICWHNQVATFVPPTGTANISRTANNASPIPDEYELEIAWSGRDNVARTASYIFSQ